jgi:hypothetical protein
MFSLLIVFTFLVPIISFIALIATIVIASVITCHCCCAGDFNLPPQVKTYATATLVSLCLMFVMQVNWAVSVIAALTKDMESSGTGSISSSTLNASMTSAGEYMSNTGFAYVLLFRYVADSFDHHCFIFTIVVVVGSLSLVFNVAWIIFSAMFTWKR